MHICVSLCIIKKLIVIIVAMITIGWEADQDVGDDAYSKAI